MFGHIYFYLVTDEIVGAVQGFFHFILSKVRVNTRTGNKYTKLLLRNVYVRQQQTTGDSVGSSFFTVYVVKLI